MILITSHINADFDSYSSMVAARLLYPEAALCFAGSAEAPLRGYLERHRERLPEVTGIRNLDFDAVRRLVCVDVSDRQRLGPLGALLDRDPPPALDVYDHHPGLCTLQGEAHLVAEAGACVSLLTEKLAERGLKPDPFTATLFLLGIYEDTGFLTYPTTRGVDFRAAERCLGWGGELAQIRRTLRRRLTKNQMGLLTEMIDGLEAVHVGGATVHLTTLTSSDYIPDLSALVHEILHLEELEVLFLLAYLDNRVHVIARSRNASVDVSEVLSVFGGGGHPSAAAATMRGRTLEEARRLLLDEITVAHPLGMKASDVFTRNFRRVEADATVREAAQEMNRYRVNALPVFRNGRLVGVITRQEVDGTLHHGYGDSLASDLVVTEPPILPPDTPVEDVRRLMLERNLRLALFGDGPEAIQGILSRMILFKSLYLVGDQPRPRRSGGKPSRGEILDHLAAAFSEEECGTLRRLGAFAAHGKMNCLLVGGAVRDLLLKRPLQDVDFVVEGDAVELARAWCAENGGSFKCHRDFGTAVWTRPDGAHWDFATARAEYYEAPAALPIVAHAALYQDLYRRDFTMNTLALHLAPDRFGEILDLFGGVRDLKAGRIQVLHGLSFMEDPTRAFRAVRFSVRLGFDMTPETVHLIRTARRQGVFRNLSAKRLLAELAQILEGPTAVEGLLALDRHGLLAAVWPKLKITPVVRERLYRLQKAADFFETNFPEERMDRLSMFLMALLFGFPVKELESFLRKYPLHRKSRDLMHEYRSLTWRARRALAAGSRSAGSVAEVLSGRPLEWVVFLLSRLDEPRQQALVRHFLTKNRFVRPDVSGDDLIEAGHFPSPGFAPALREALRAKIDGRAKGVHSQIRIALSALQRWEAQHPADERDTDPPK